MEVSYKKHVIKYGEKQTVIDRINNESNYYKKNCRWVTPSENNLNSSRAKSKRICQKCIEFRKYKGLGWRKIASLTKIPPSTICYHLYGHKNYH